ncbi:MAG: hypothetical protein ABSC55_28195 [Syntrophorhabdales bacterium]|jgi:outer membrane murein-binding lipoprotein Lpp
MSYILDALKRAEQRDRQGKAPKSRTVEPAVESSAWQVKMVSPARYARLRLKAEGEDDLPEKAEEKCETEGAGSRIGMPDIPTDALEPKVRDLPKGAGIAAAVLTLLLLIECAVVYDVRARMSAIATEVSKLTRQISETEVQTAKSEGARLNLKLENDSLRQELEAASADLARARNVLQTLKARQKRASLRKRQPTVTEQKKSRALPLASAPLPPMGYRPPRAERASGLDAVETATATIYSIR